MSTPHGEAGGQLSDIYYDTCGYINRAGELVYPLPGSATKEITSMSADRTSSAAPSTERIVAAGDKLAERLRMHLALAGTTYEPDKCVLCKDALDKWEALRGA